MLKFLPINPKHNKCNYMEFPTFICWYIISKHNSIEGWLHSGGKFSAGFPQRRLQTFRWNYNQSLVALGLRKAALLITLTPSRPPVMCIWYSFCYNVYVYENEKWYFYIILLILYKHLAKTIIDTQKWTRI